MFWTFNFYPAHSSGFFIKKEVHDKVGDYSLKFPCSSDYDFFWRLIKKNNYKGISTKKNEIIGVFESGGFSQDTEFLNIFGRKHLLDYTTNKVRL